MFYTVFSTNDSPYMQWQSDLLEYSWKNVGQEGELIRLVATNDPANSPAQKHARCVTTKLWDVHPDTGDAWPIYNKPASLLEWLYTERPEGTLLFIDPDCIFTKPIRQRVVPGSPVAQSWIDLHPGEPSRESPFGLSSRFSFLVDHCSNVEIKTDAVMIPTLIHTRDLRKICPRWLELCGIIRESAVGANAEKMWEADMFAYIVACAEYGIVHEPASLGICTNWDPAALDDPAIVHYCQPIHAKNGKELFNKYHYQPWARVDDTLEPERNDGRDLVRTVNSFVDDMLGVITKAASHRVPCWEDGVMEGRVLDDLMLESHQNGQKLWLNASGKAIWTLCDGSRDVNQITQELSQTYGEDVAKLEPDVFAAIGQLKSAGFLTLR